MAISDVLGERRTVGVPAGTLEYRERGDGPPVVFVHGAAVNGDLWRKVAPELATDHRCIVPDLPLGGHSIPLDGRPDLSLFGAADVLASFLDALDLTDVTLVANDTGGAISQALVGRRPRRVGRLVLTSCDAFENYPPKAVAYLKLMVRVAPALWLLVQAMRFAPLQRAPIAYGWATHDPIEPAIMESYLGSMRANAGVRRDFAALLSGARGRDCVEASEGVAGFDRPALVVWAADDRFFPREHGRRLAALLPQGRFALVERSRTFIPEDNPAALVGLIRGFLAEHESGLEPTDLARATARICGMDQEHARELLARERARIESALAKLGLQDAVQEEDPFDQADGATDLLGEEIDLSLAGSMRDELAAIERAETRLADGTYGLSVESGDPVPDARLELIPWAERTAEEQGKIDSLRA